MFTQTFNSIADTIGNTPLIRLNKLTEGLNAEVFVKCEFFNPLFSVKDRIGKAMIDTAIAEGRLQPGGIVVEPTSGNTGIALAFICASRGIKCVLTMPETMSLERRVLLRMLGAEIVLTPGSKGMSGAIAKAEALTRSYGDQAFMPMQFSNAANPEIHRKTTAEEIWAATQGRIDAFVAGVGTGGTITGVGEVLKPRTQNQLRVVAVEPTDSPVISGGKPGPHKIQGIGAGFIPKNLNTSILDEIVTCTNDNAFTTAQKLSQLEGIPAGISTGANVWACLQLASRPEMAGKRIVTIGCSSTERYLSTALAERVRTEVMGLTASE